ncbi:hypothetical protein LCGC14_1549770 [marine sediment metagenome]|uniref:Uncharacterized protein n=1 Tax=marine sediment metagenome TaxID=412755 RepID=A0A0F9JBN6_9ZZZZ
MTNWLKGYCQVCWKGITFPENDVGYELKTCDNFSCAFEYAHNPAKYKSLHDHLDSCRVKARI